MNDSIIADYEEACAEFGKQPGRLIRGGSSVYITDDPERGWRELGPCLLHYMKSYAKWSETPDSASPLHGLDTIEKVRAANLVHVFTPDEAVAFGRTRTIGLQPLIGGLHPDLGWKSLTMFVEKVLPRIKGAREEWLQAQGA